MYKLSMSDFGKAGYNVRLYRNDTKNPVSMYKADGTQIYDPATDANGKLEIYVPEQGAYDVEVDGYRYYATAGIPTTADKVKGLSTLSGHGDLLAGQKININLAKINIGEQQCGMHTVLYVQQGYNYGFVYFKANVMQTSGSWPSFTYDTMSNGMSPFLKTYMSFAFDEEKIGITIENIDTGNVVVSWSVVSMCPAELEACCELSASAHSSREDGLSKSFIPLPACSSSDNGKVLKVVSGKPSWQSA